MWYSHDMLPQGCIVLFQKYIEESRKIIAEQDAAFQESLAIDRAKNMKKAEESMRKEVLL